MCPAEEKLPVDGIEIESIVRSEGDRQEIAIARMADKDLGLTADLHIQQDGFQKHRSLGRRRMD